jgi:3-dehydroquinate synthase
LHRLRVRLKSRPANSEILIRSGLLREAGEWLREDLKRTKRIALISNETVFSLYGADVIRGLKTAGFLVSHFLIGDGERHKSLKTLEKAVNFLQQSSVERTDAVIALGGGVVGDVAGFAAAVYLRGIAFIQMPTTLLAQIDASVGGKTGVNLAAGKNLLGSFHQPRSVFVDPDTLRTLPARELTSGWCECVKQGAVGDKKLFDQTVHFLKTGNADQLENLIAAHCRFKTRIVENDEREAPDRTDAHSRRILNFGHTIAHALETVTGYRRFRHGEAVGYGMLVAGELSKNLGLLSQTELELLTEAVHLCGPLPAASGLDHATILRAIAHDKKSTGGQVQWVLLEGIGRARIVDGKQVKPALLKQTLQSVLGRK